MRYINPPEYRHDGAERLGILLVNSGTPATPEPRDVRAFLKGLLSDPRVVEVARSLWLPILYGFILPFRPRRVAVKYRKIWTAQGSPLVVFSNRLRADLATTLAQRLLAPLPVAARLRPPPSPPPPSPPVLGFLPPPTKPRGGGGKCRSCELPARSAS